MEPTQATESIEGESHAIISQPTSDGFELPLFGQAESVHKLGMPGHGWPQVFRLGVGDVEPDVSLLALVALGNETAMVDLYDRHCTFVYSIARRILDPSLVEECLHQVFMALWRIPADFTSGRRGLLGCLADQTWKRAVASRTDEKASKRLSTVPYAT